MKWEMSILAALCLSPLMSGISAAEDALLPEPSTDMVREAQAKLKVSFNNLSIVDFRESPLPGLYQADIGGRIVYYSPDPELLIFGQIFDKTGTDLTSLALSETHLKRRKVVDLDKALTIGATHGPEIVEFTNPECGYCRLLNNFFEAEFEQGRPVRRKIIFSTSTETGLRQAEHILCAENPELAFSEVYAGAAPSRLNSCPEGRERAEAHARMSRQAGIQGTPTVWLDDRTVEGFRSGEILAFLQTKRGK